MASLSDLIESNKNGWMPVGTVIPVMSNIAGAIAIPASGTVVDGMMYCDGTAIPGGQALSGSTPDLNGNVFLQGSSSAGAAGGSNMMTDHTHSFSGTYPNHTHTDDFSISSSGAHSHTYTNFSSGTFDPPSTGWSGDQGGTALNNHSVPSVGSNHTHPIDGGITSSGGGSISGSVGGGSAPTSTDNRPSYVSVQYLIRVK